MDPIPLPAPFGGIDEKTPIIAVQSPYAETIMNFNVTNAGLELRNGDSFYANPTGTAGADCIGLRLGVYSDSVVIAALYDPVSTITYFVNVDSGAVLLTSGAIGQSNFFPVYFNGYLYFWTYGVHAPGYYYDGSVMGAITYSGSGLLPVAGTAYKNRQYVIQYATAQYWYSGIDSVTGTLTSVNLASLVPYKAFLAVITPITIADNVSAQSLLAFVFHDGTVLFYSGSYPNSADWTLQGQGKIGPLLLYNSAIPYQGDTLIATDQGFTSLRDLFLKGSLDARELSVNDRVTATWQALTKGIRSQLSTPSGLIVGQYNFLQSVWDAVTSRLIISVGWVLDDEAVSGVSLGMFYFVFNAELQSWTFHRTYSQENFITAGGTRDIVLYKNKILVLGGGSNLGTYYSTIYQKEGATGFTDRDMVNNAEVGYDYEIQSAPLANGRNYVQQVTGMDVILKSDLYDQTTYQFIRDFGVSETVAQKINGTGISGNFAKPMVNAGIEGSYVQYNISGTTTTDKTEGYQLYGTNVWITMGDSPR